MEGVAHGLLLCSKIILTVVSGTPNRTVVYRDIPVLLPNLAHSSTGSSVSRTILNDGLPSVAN